MSEQPYIPMLCINPLKPFDGAQVLVFYESFVNPDGARTEKRWKRKTVDDPWEEIISE